MSPPYYDDDSGEQVGEEASDLIQTISGELDESVISGLSNDEVGRKVRAMVRRAKSTGRPAGSRGLGLGLLPFSFDIGANATVAQEVKAVGGEVIQLRRLHVDDDIAGDTWLADLKIGNRSVYLTDGEISMNAFRNTATNPLPLDDAYISPGGIIIVKVRNSTAAVVRFNGVFVARVLGRSGA